MVMTPPPGIRSSIVDGGKRVNGGEEINEGGTHTKTVGGGTARFKQPRGREKRNHRVRMK